MWAEHNSGLWPDLDAREQSRYGGRLYAGGFVFSDPPEAVFRGIGEDYVRDAWSHVCQVLGRHRMSVVDLSWGAMHPGVTMVAGGGGDWRDPGRYLGWTSWLLNKFDEDARWGAVDEELRHRSPQLRCAVTCRSHQWRIAGDEIALGLRLFEAVATDDITAWNPSHIFEVLRDESEPWIRAAVAIRDVDQRRLDQALAEAGRIYSPIGYRVVVRGYRAYAAYWASGLEFPPVPDSVPPQPPPRPTPSPESLGGAVRRWAMRVLRRLV